MSKKSITFCDVNGQTHDFPIETPDYGTCATAGDVAEKVVVSESFSLYTGAKVTVKFANANTAGTITLNVNGTGANTVYFPGDGTYTTDAGEIIQAGGCYDFVYDDGWRFVGAAGGTENVDIDVENNRLLVGDGANGFYDQHEPTKNIVVVGNNATASAVSVTIGNNAGSSGTNGVAIGNNSKNSGADNIAIGCDATTTGVGSVAVGSSASVTQQGGVAVGAGAQATASGAIQIGEGTNSTANTFQVGEYTVLDADGKIPDERVRNGVFYGTCSTSPSTSAKVVTCEGFSLYEGAKIVVWFEWAHEAATMTMNVNNTGAKQVIFPGVSSSSTVATGKIGQKSAYLFVYNGTYWVLCGSSPVSCDNQTLELVNGKLALKGFSNATSGQMPRVNEDGTGIEWYMPISERTVIPNVPSQSGTLTYTGSSKTPSWSNYDSSKMTLSVTSQVNAGTYTATFTPKEAYRWADGTIDPKTVNWTINKAAGSITLNKTSITLNKNTKTATFTVTRAGNGKISVSSNKTSVATVSPTSSTSTGTVTFTVSSVNSTNGDATITVSVAAGTNYNSISKTVSVSAIMVDPTLENNTPEEIQMAAQSGQAENIWSVGDKIPITINGTTANLRINGTYYAIILGFDHNYTREGKNSIHFQIDADSNETKIAFCDISYMSEGTSIGFRMYRSKTNSGGWEDSYMRTSACSSFLGILPTEWQNVISYCTKYSDNTGGGNDTSSYVTSTQDKIWLLSEYEVWGRRYYANSSEKNYQRQYDYYKNGNSKIRYKHNSTGTKCIWWLRSVNSSSSTGFCTVFSSGSYSKSAANISFGFSPGFKVA